MLLTLLFSAGADGLTVQVDPAGGAPRLLVNGKPVRARMFWGGPGSAPLAVSPQGKPESFDFTAVASAENGTLHFRFGEVPGEVDIDDVTVTDLTTNQVLFQSDFEHGAAEFRQLWHFWPTGPANTVGTAAVLPGIGSGGTSALRVQLREPPALPWPGYHIYSDPRLHIVAGHQYRVNFWARAEPARSLEVALYRPGDPFVRLGGPADVFVQQIRLAADAGVNFVSYQVPVPWPAPGQVADWAAADALCADVLTANPRALLIPRVVMNPPVWWCQAHPEEVMRWEEGTKADATHGLLAVPASPLYRADAAARLTAFIEHMEAKFGNHVAGYHVAGQNTAEWFYQGTWETPLNGYAPADLRGWRAWLLTRYRTEAALQQAWAQPAARLADATVPTPAERHAAPDGPFWRGAQAQPLVDWGDFQQDAMADCVTTLAQAARTASRGRKLVLFFYGYLFEFAAVPTNPAVCGHYALRRVLDCPAIDVLCSPISYFDRGLGQSAPSMSAAESVELAGKLWLNEDDTHVYLATGEPPGVKDHVNTPEASIALLTRNVAEAALRNFGTWWMDLGATGWFNDARFWQRMAALSVLDDPLLAHPTPFRPEVAAIIDERTMLHVAAGGATLTRPRISGARAPLGRLGAPYGQYLLSDLLAGRLHAKLYVILDPWLLTPADRAKIVEAAQGARLLWCEEGSPLLTSDSLRQEAQAAGVHLFTETDCNVSANGPYLALHASQDGPLEVHLPAAAQVRDLLTGEVLGKGPTLTLPIKRGETRVLQY